MACGAFFAFRRECLTLLFHSAAYSILSWCSEQGFVPGITAVMHTFGCTLNFHPHIHILVSDGGLSSLNGSFSWKPCSFFPEKVLKARFRYLLVKKLRQWVCQKLKEKTLSIPVSIQTFWRKKYGIADFFSVTQLLYKVIWYVFIGEKLSNAYYTTRYIGRYAKRPCLSETNIVYYSYEQQLVSFAYKDKIIHSNKSETIPVEEFIKRLIRHIPEKNFRMIRHYGFYANRIKNSLLDTLVVFVTARSGSAFVLYDPDALARSWRLRIRRSTGSDPLICPRCRVEMKLIERVVMTRAGPKTISFVN